MRLDRFLRRKFRAAHSKPRQPQQLRLEALEDRFLPTTVGFVTTTFGAAENVGSTSITVSLNASSSQTITVDYATSDGTAVAGSDYTGVSGTLTFNPGTTSKTFAVTNGTVGHCE